MAARHMPQPRHLLPCLALSLVLACTPRSSRSPTAAPVHEEASAVSLKLTHRVTARSLPVGVGSAGFAVYQRQFGPGPSDYLVLLGSSVMSLEARALKPPPVPFEFQVQALHSTPLADFIYGRPSTEHSPRPRRISLHTPRSPYRMIARASGQVLAEGSIGKHAPCGDGLWIEPIGQMLIAVRGGLALLDPASGKLRFVLSKGMLTPNGWRTGIQRCLVHYAKVDGGWVIAWTEGTLEDATHPSDLESGDWHVRTGVLRLSGDNKVTLEPQRAVPAKPSHKWNDRMRILALNGQLTLLYKGDGGVIYRRSIGPSGLEAERVLVPAKPSGTYWDACEFNDRVVVLRSSPLDSNSQNTPEVITQDIGHVRLIEALATRLICTDNFVAIVQGRNESAIITEVDVRGPAGSFEVKLASHPRQDLLDQTLSTEPIAKTCRWSAGRKARRLFDLRPLESEKERELLSVLCDAGCLALCRKGEPKRLQHLRQKWDRCQQDDENACASLLEETGLRKQDQFNACLVLGRTACVGRMGLFVSKYQGAKVACLTGLKAGCDGLEQYRREQAERSGRR